nr:putative protein TPRXL [Biomphalaria glabrata]
MSAHKDRAFASVKAVDRLTPLEDADREEGPSSMRDVSGDKPVSSGEINGSATVKGSNSHLFHTADETKDSKQNKVDSQNSSHGNSKGSHQSLSLNFFSKSPETRPLLSSSSTSPTSPTSASPSQTPASTAPTSAVTNFHSNSSEPSASPEEGTPLSDVEKLKQKINSMTSANALGNGKSSSHPEFHHLKSAMKHSGEDGKKGKRKMSLLDTVMRRVSIHRKDSTPSGRIATFFFGSAEDAMKEDSEEEEGRDNGDTDVEGKGHSDEHGHHSGKTAAERKQHQVAILKENLFMILSGLYGVVIVILGAVLPITEIFVKNEKERSFEAFYLYLYIVSIIFLVYVYAYLLRRNRLKTEFLTRTLSRSLSWTRNWAKSWAKADEATKGKLRKRMTSLDVDNHHTGTFYLRLGVLGFGIGSMIHSGLNFGKFFAVTEAACQEALDAVKPLFHLVFTFFQLYFIFMNSKMCIHRYKRLARFGLMHMCATNICVWFQSIVVETLHVIHMHHHNSQHSDHGSGGDHGGGHGDATSHPDDDHGHDDHLGPTASPHKILSTTIKVGRRLHAG